MTIAGLAALLLLHGCHLPCQAGVISNFTAEVGPQLDPGTVSPSGIGLPQFAGVLRSRYLVKAGSQWRSAERQIDFMVEVLGELGIKDELFREPDPARAAVLFAARFEKPRNRDYRHRAAGARSIYRGLQ